MTGSLQHAVLFHGTQPDDTRGRLFHAGDDVGDQLVARLGRECGGPLPDLGMQVIQAAQRDEDHGADQVGAVVHRDVGLVLQGGGDVTIIAVLVLALDRIDRDAEIFHQAGRDVVLGRQRVGGAEQQIGAAGLEGLRQVGGLGGDVQAGRHPHPGQRLFLLETLADRPQNGHVALGPVDPFPALFSQFEILDVTRHGGNSGRSCQFQYSSRAEVSGSGAANRSTHFSRPHRQAPVGRYVNCQARARLMLRRKLLRCVGQTCATIWFSEFPGCSKNATLRARQQGDTLPAAKKGRSIAVMVGLEGAFLGDVDIGGLFWRQFG